jgi:hypothetical protein
VSRGLIGSRRDDPDRFLALAHAIAQVRPLPEAGHERGFTAGESDEHLVVERQARQTAAGPNADPPLPALAGQQPLAVTLATLRTLAVWQPWLGAHDRSFRRGPLGAGRQAPEQHAVRHANLKGAGPHPAGDRAHEIEADLYRAAPDRWRQQRRGTRGGVSFGSIARKPMTPGSAVGELIPIPPSNHQQRRSTTGTESTPER